MLAPTWPGRAHAWPDACCGSDASHTSSVFRSRLAAQRPANRMIACDGHSVGFVTATEQILIVLHTAGRHER
jgi:hypothetical protein